MKIDPEGQVKVLDFGLAKALDPPATSSASSPDITHSPTMSLGTQAGMILGTAAYMSPEQAGESPWKSAPTSGAFGVVLYEMLTGKRLFAGETVSDTLAAVLRHEIRLDALPPETPAVVRNLLVRCLERDPKNRLRDIGEARIALGAVAGGESAETPTQTVSVRRGIPLPVFAAALVAAAGTAALLALLFAKRSSVSAGESPAVTEFAIGANGLVGMDL